MISTVPGRPPDLGCARAHRRVATERGARPRQGDGAAGRGGGGAARLRLRLGRAPRHAAVRAREQLSVPALGHRGGDVAWHAVARPARHPFPVCRGHRPRAPRHQRARAALPQPAEPRGRGGGARRPDGGPLRARRGCGWMREEFTALGIDPDERGARTDEHIEVLRTLWTQDPASFDGRFNEFDGIVLATTPAPRAARRSGWAATPTRRCAARCASATAGTASRSTPRTCRT